MPVRTISAALAAMTLLGTSLGARAADFSFVGQLDFHSSIAKIEFAITQGAETVRLWTDSFQSGHNFDPTLALWVRSGSGYTLLTEVDDDSTLAAGQTDFDAGIEVPGLQAGRYLVTLTASPNYAAGTALTDGFAFDGESPIPISAWNQPGYDINANDQKGDFWRLNLRNVDSAAPVPEPGSYLLLAFGLVALWLMHRASSKD